MKVEEAKQTVGGHPVRIYATDGSNVFPIHGAVFVNEEWQANSWTADGFNNCDKAYSRLDLDLHDWRDAIPGERCPICTTNLRDYINSHIPARPETEELEPPPIPESERCPWCGGRLRFREGCEQCPCGYSACG